MLKGFGNFLLKELKELVRDPKIFLGMIILPLLMFPVLGVIMSFSVQSTIEQAQKATLLVLDNDEGNNSLALIDFLNLSIRVSRVENTTPPEAVSQNLLSENNATQMVEIPSDFSEKMLQHQSNSSVKAEINFFSVFQGSGLFESIGSSVVDNAVYQFNRALAPDLVSASKSAIIKGNITYGVDPATLNNLMIGQAIAMPITIMILLSYSMQIAATSVAMEKEEKTLETLLTLPMDRFAILMGKLSGSIIVAAVGAVAYMIGFNYYMGSFIGAIPAGSSIDLVELGLVPTAFGYLLMGMSLFVALLSALALAVIISAFAENVRSAQSVVGYIYPLVFVPSLLLMYINVNTLPLAARIVVYAIPYSHPIIASRAVVMGDYLTVVLGIIYVSAFTLVVMYVASRLFATEKILTAKLRFRRLRRRRRAPPEELQ